MEIETTVQFFLSAKHAENRSQGTIDWYDNALYRMLRRMPEMERLDDLNAITIRAYILLMQEDPGLRDVSVTKNVRAIRAFCRWLVREELLKADPFTKVPVPSFEKRELDIVSDSDFKALLAACDRNTDKGRRDEAILMFLFDTGVRVGELVALKTEHLDLKSRQARVVGKGRKWRTVFFSAQTATALHRYLARRMGREYVFVGWGEKPLTVFGVNQMLKRLAERSGVKARVNPHSFRHTFATNYLRMGGDPATLQRILGHSDVSTTIRNYAHLVDADLRKAHDQFSPMGRALGRGR
jgi:site-specific recombinase XerD